MALIVGTDSYVTVTEADTYIAANYISTSSEAVAWAAVSSANKDIYLRKALQKIDRQPYTGVKSVTTQTLQFPRAVWTEYRREDVPLLNISLDGDWVVQTVTPDAVKNAQIEEALSNATGTPKRLSLQRQGVKSFSLGNLSETYTVNYNDLTSYEAKQLLRPYLAGSVSIC